MFQGAASSSDNLFGFRGCEAHAFRMPGLGVNRLPSPSGSCFMSDSSLDSPYGQILSSSFASS